MTNQVHDSNILLTKKGAFSYLEQFVFVQGLETALGLCLCLMLVLTFVNGYRVGGYIR
jgi:hypothetical protein